MQNPVLLFLIAMPCMVFSQSANFTSDDAGADISQPRTCAAHEKHVEMMGFQKFADARQQIDNHRAQWAPIVEEQRASGSSVVVSIPVVFHVLYANSTENIADSEIQEQLQTLNDDFRRQNSDQDNIWAQAADTEIEFCLASFDPSGAPTNGILRVPTTVSSFGTNDAMKFSNQGGSDAWPASDYLNFWVCNLGGGLLGYAQFPGGPAATDGVVCGYPYVGNNGPVPGSTTSDAQEPTKWATGWTCATSGVMAVVVWTTKSPTPLNLTHPTSIAPWDTRVAVRKTWSRTTWTILKTPA